MGQKVFALESMGKIELNRSIVYKSNLLCSKGQKRFRFGLCTLFLIYMDFEISFLSKWGTPFGPKSLFALESMGKIELNRSIVYKSNLLSKAQKRFRFGLCTLFLIYMDFDFIFKQMGNPIWAKRFALESGEN